MTEFIIFLALTAFAAVVVVFVTRTYGAADAREQAARAVEPRVEPDPRSGADRRVRKDRRQSVRYEPAGSPRRAGSRRRSYEELLRRSAEVRNDRSRDTSRSPPPYPG